MITFADAFKKSFIEGFGNNGVTTSSAVTILLVAFFLGVYIYFIYKLVNKSSLYDRTFHVAMSIIGVITAGIIVAMQSSIVISLGMVGALSIVRFRTAVKDTMDLLFLFWSIGEGIICGAGLFKIAVLVALVVTIGIFLLEYLPANKKPSLLMVNCENIDVEDGLMAVLDSYARYKKVRSRNLKETGFDIVLEVLSKDEKGLLKAITDIKGVTHVSLLSQSGEVRL